MRWVLLALLLGACTGELTVVQPVEISGTVAAVDGDDSPIKVEAYQAWVGEGSLEYPMRRVGGRWVEEPGDYSLSVELPVEEGEGLVVYGWQDRDGDGDHCAPGVDDEPAGVVVVSEGTVPDSVEAELLLDSPCVGSTRLFP
jgi:hypothetical protein